jgi:hypothetical protein
MNRRRILTLLAGSGAALSSRYASAADGNSGSTTPAKPGPTRRGGIVSGSGVRPDLKLSGPSRQVRSIAYSRSAYSSTGSRERVLARPDDRNADCELSRRFCGASA